MGWSVSQARPYALADDSTDLSAEDAEDAENGFVTVVWGHHIRDRYALLGESSDNSTTGLKPLTIFITSSMALNPLPLR